VNPAGTRAPRALEPLEGVLLFGGEPRRLAPDRRAFRERPARSRRGQWRHAQERGHRLGPGQRLQAAAVAITGSGVARRIASSSIAANREAATGR
jgi:hypothetical protein